MLEGIPDGVIVCDAEGQIAFANRAAEALSGYRRSELVGHKVELLVPAGQRAQHAKDRRRFYLRGQARRMGRPENDFKLRRNDGTLAPVDIALGPVGSHTVAVIRDVTEQRALEAALEHRALHDPLTDLANRNLFFDRLRQSIASARRQGHQIALVMLDLDGFKAINDAYGHAVGDGVLKEIGHRLGAGLRATDTAARIGGDEFALILPRVTSHAGVQRLVQARLASIREPITLRGEHRKVAISAGIAMYPDDGRDVDTLMRHADAAMYSAKREGRAVVFHLSRKHA